MSVFSQLVVGIFSREDPSCYQWLVNVVQSVSGVKSVLPVSITNTWSQFANQVPLCSIAILYHSKNRGRVNVTDVTDSLYDEELQHLSRVLGKEKVIVVIDDLKQTSETEKNQILISQPSIGNLANHLFLFNGEQGTEGAKLRSFQNLIRNKGKSHSRKKLSQRSGSDREENEETTLIREEVSSFRAFISNFSIWIIFFTVVLVIVIIIIIVKCLEPEEGSVPTVSPTHEIFNITNLTTLYPTPGSTVHNSASIPSSGSGHTDNTTLWARNTTV